MKAASAGLIAHLATNNTGLAICIRIERQDGQVFGFTSHDRDLVVSGTTYRAAPGLRPTAISTRADLAVDETEQDIVLDDDGILESDIRAGLWDHAAFRVFLVNWANLGHGELKLRRGRLGEAIVRDDGAARIEMRGLTQALQQVVGELYSPTCRADLGDSRCKIPIRPGLRANSTAYAVGDFVRVRTAPGNEGSYAEEYRIYECTTAGTTAGSAPTFNTTLAATTTDGSVTWTAREPWTRPAEVDSATDRETIVLVADGIEGFADGWFDGGVAVFETGDNAGVARDVLSWDQSSRTLTLFLPLPYDAAAGDVLRVQPGCDKLLATCRTKFDNRLNFRGEPHIPGGNAVIETSI